MPDLPEIQSVTVLNTDNLRINWDDPDNTKPKVKISFEPSDNLDSIINHLADDVGTDTIEDVSALHHGDDCYPITISIARSTSEQPVNPSFGNGSIQSTIVDKKVLYKVDVNIE